MTAVVEIDLPSRRATLRLARRLASHAVAGDLLVLEGPLGAGKTFLARGFLRARGLPAVERVTSPTFTLVNEYPLVPPIAHADVYRIRNEDEVAALGVDALRREGRVVVVEWGLDHLRVLGGDGLVVQLAVAPRRARVSATGARSQRWFERACAAEPGVGD